jgi:hypothetical protein
MRNHGATRATVRLYLFLKYAFVTAIVVAIATFNSCQKDTKQTNTQLQNSSSVSPLQNSAYAYVQQKVSKESFDDLDWQGAEVRTFNGAPYLLIISSKSNSSKQLLYTQQAGVSNASWLQIKRGSDDASESIITSELNGSKKNESILKNGRIYARVDSTGTKLVINKENEPVSTISADPRVSVNMLQTEDSEDDPTTPPGGEGTAYTITVNDDVATITASPINGSGSVTLYSLYVLTGNNPLYLNQYTTNPNAGGSSSGSGGGGISPSTVILVTPTGAATGTDPHFVKGKTPAIGHARYTPAGSTIGGWQVTIGYTATTVNGVITPTVTTLTANTISTVSMVATYQTDALVSSVTGSVISFSFSGSNNYGVGDATFHDPLTITGSYNTSTGLFSLNVHRQ